MTNKYSEKIALGTYKFNSTENYFEPEVKKKTISEDGLVFVFVGNELLLINDKIPLYKNVQKLISDINYQKYIGKINNDECFVIDAGSFDDFSSAARLIGLRKLYAEVPESQMRAAVFASQIVLWNNKNQYCGQCGSKTEETSPGILVKECSKCKSTFYPKISPSIIVAITKKDEILLAQHNRITSGMYTTLAGFANPGETLEECVRREVKEEAGIEIRNIKYFGSQPWPFPDSLMIAYTAEYAGGELKPDNEEVIDLKWFKADEIPEWPDKVSIARALIDQFIDNNTNI